MVFAHFRIDGSIFCDASAVETEVAASANSVAHLAGGSDDEAAFAGSEDLSGMQADH